MRRTLRSRAAVIAAAGALALVPAAPASAQPPQQVGLVNVTIEDNTVVVPVAVAANICDVNVAVLVGELRDDGEATCTNEVGQTVTITPAG
jgi:hypothetical protein